MHGRVMILMMMTIMMMAMMTVIELLMMMMMAMQTQYKSQRRFIFPEKSSDVTLSLSFQINCLLPYYNAEQQTKKYDKFKFSVNVYLSDPEIRPDANNLTRAFLRDLASVSAQGILKVAAFAQLRSCFTFITR